MNPSYLQENSKMENSITMHNFERASDLTQSFDKELFMANLGLRKVINVLETQNGNNGNRIRSTQETNGLLNENQCKKNDKENDHTAQVRANITNTGKETLSQPREVPLRKMILWLMELPQQFDLSRVSFSALRCNECYKCEGVEYPCVRCGQQFHQECHVDQGLRRPHRLCPSCTRQTVKNPNSDSA